MTKDDLFLKIREILASEFEIEPEKVNPESKLYDDLDLDSIDAVDLIVKMKEHVPGKIDPVVFKNARTIQDIVGVLYPLLEQPNS
ncbi:MAG: phosphopantetheine-binding protein [Treponema sp.]|jgi:acyl carrier protein|nr:phosphopantetheine-binding protein [Treponema sp.]